MTFSPRDLWPRDLLALYSPNGEPFTVNSILRYHKEGKATVNQTNRALIIGVSLMAKACKLSSKDVAAIFVKLRNENPGILCGSPVFGAK